MGGIGEHWGGSGWVALGSTRVCALRCVGKAFGGSWVGVEVVLVDVVKA